DKLDGLIAAAGVKSWSELFIKRCGLDTEANERWQNPDRPVMEPWVIKQPYSGGATVVTLERNPYYHKVDTAGNQLPYIDKLQVSVNADDQTLVLKAVNGEIDYQDRHINKNSNRAVYLDKAYPKKDAQGFRLGPDGKRITFAVLVIPALGDFVDAAQLVGQYWQAVGVDAKVQTVDRTLFYDRKDHNDQDATVFQGSG